jgi:hypothetical protein
MRGDRLDAAAARCDDAAPATPAVLGAATLGRALAQSVIAESGPLAAGAAAFARAWSLEADRLTVELFYLSLLTTRFAVDVGLPAREGAEARAAFEHALLASAGDRVNEAGLAARLREYRDAFADRPPELGRAYAIGRTFARLCHSGREVAVIECGARVYIEQLAARLRLLAEVTVVSASPAG